MLVFAQRQRSILLLIISRRQLPLSSPHRTIQKNTMVLRCGGFGVNKFKPLKKFGKTKHLHNHVLQRQEASFTLTSLTFTLNILPITLHSSRVCPFMPSLTAATAPLAL